MIFQALVIGKTTRQATTHLVPLGIGRDDLAKSTRRAMTRLVHLEKVYDDPWKGMGRSPPTSPCTIETGEPISIDRPLRPDDPDSCGCDLLPLVEPPLLTLDLDFVGVRSREAVPTDRFPVDLPLSTRVETCLSFQLPF